MHSQLSIALRVSRDVWGRNAMQATKHMLIVMAQSMGAMTKQSPKRRPVKTDNHGSYVERWKNGTVRKDYKWMHSEERQAAQISSMKATWGKVYKSRLLGSWESAQAIRNRGLAKRSWLWGLSSIKGDVAGFTGAGSHRPPIAGVVQAHSINAQGVIGHILTNRLSYINATIPPNYQQIAESKAINKVMKQAEMKMVREFEREIGRVAA